MEDKPIVHRYALSVSDQESFFIGHKFEMLSTLTRSTWKSFRKGNISHEALHTMIVREPVDEVRQFGVLAKSKLGGKRIILGAEVDCVGESSRCLYEETEPELSDFVEIKTHFCRSPRDLQGQLLMKGWKPLRLWAQSYLIGIEKIYIGRRTPENNIYSSELSHVSDLPPNPARYQDEYFWRPKICLASADFLLSEITAFLKRSTTNMAHVEFAGNDVFMNEAAEMSDFLPDWWKDFILKR
jgi:hypothetical protein